MKQAADEDGRLRPDAATVFDSGPFAPLCENVTSSTKPEVHNILHCRQTRTGNTYRKFRKIWTRDF